LDRDSEAQLEFSEAIRIFPELLAEDEIFYAVACANQPIAYKSSGEFLDLASGERQLFRAIQAVQASDMKQPQQVYARAYLTLGRLAYGQRHMDVARRYLYLALKYDIHCLRNSNVLQLLAKSLIGPKWLDILKGLKEHNFVKVN
jgi:hypothetical protein